MRRRWCLPPQPAGSRRRVFLPTPDRAIAIRDNFSLHHLNCGIAGTVMRGGGGAATLGALRIPLGSVLLSALLSAPAFARPPAGFPLRPSLRLARHHLRLAQMKRQEWPRP